MSFFNDYSIPWHPSWVAQMWSTSGSVSSIPLSAGFVSCTVGLSFYAKFRMLAMAPAVTAVVLLAIPAWSYLAALCRAVRSTGTGHRGGASAPGQAHVGSVWSTYTTAWLVLAYLIYPSVSRQVVRVLDCSERVDGVRYIESDLREQCGTSTHTLHVVVGLAVVAVFCFGFPAVVGWSLKRRYDRDTLHSDATRRQFLFMYEGYTDKWCWWVRLLSRPV